MRATFMAFLLSLMAASVLAQDPPSEAANDADRATQSDQATDAKAAQTSAESAEPKKLTLPPGFKPKKRGDVTLYCIKGKETGTRFETETCYDEVQLHAYILAREQDQIGFDQGRSVCATGSACRVQ